MPDPLPGPQRTERGPASLAESATVGDLRALVTIAESRRSHQDKRCPRILPLLQGDGLRLFRVRMPLKGVGSRGADPASRWPSISPAVTTSSVDP